MSSSIIKQVLLSGMAIMSMCGVTAIASEEEAREEVITPLYRAAFYNDIDKVVSLIKRGADVNAKNKARSQRYRNIEIPERLETPLFAAVDSGTAEMVRVLLDNGAKVNVYAPLRGTPLNLAVGNGNPEIVRMLIDRGADVNAKVETCTTSLLTDDWTVSVKTKISPLHTLSIGGYSWDKRQDRIDIMKMLIKKGADVNMRDPVSGMTPLHCMARHRKPELMKVLMENGADVNARGIGIYREVTPLSCAIKSNNFDMAKYLRDHGAKANDEEIRLIDEDEKSIARSRRSVFISALFMPGIMLMYLGISIFLFEVKFKQNRESNPFGTLNAYVLSILCFSTIGLFLGCMLIPVGTGPFGGLQIITGGILGVVIGVPAGVVVAFFTRMSRKVKRNRAMYYAAPAALLMIYLIMSVCFRI